MRPSTASENPPADAVLERLVTHFGSQAAFARNLGVAKEQVSRWRGFGYVPETYALDVHDLRVRDDHGLITAVEVLSEARRARAKRLGP